MMYLKLRTEKSLLHIAIIVGNKVAELSKDGVRRRMEFKFNTNMVECTSACSAVVVNPLAPSGAANTPTFQG